MTTNLEATSPRGDGSVCDMQSHGEIAAWSSDLGCGLIASPETPGGCRFHFSAFHPTPGAAREMRAHEIAELGLGMPVEFTYEATQQDGLAYRALTVRSVSDAPREVGPDSQNPGDG